jgi:hypothetical protein
MTSRLPVGSCLAAVGPNKPKASKATPRIEGLIRPLFFKFDLHPLNACSTLITWGGAGVKQVRGPLPPMKRIAVSLHEAMVPNDIDPTFVLSMDKGMWDDVQLTPPPEGITANRSAGRNRPVRWKTVAS